VWIELALVGNGIVGNGIVGNGIVGNRSAVTARWS
jgi:hypothetical protein